MTIDGRSIADELYASLTERRSHIARPVTLGIVVGGANPVIESFVRIKAKAARHLDITLVRSLLPLEASTEDAIERVRQLAEQSDGLIVQLPLLDQIDADAVLAAIPPEKDVDGISPHPIVRAPVAKAVAEILRRGGVKIAGKRAVVVGSGRLVGQPVAEMLESEGASVTVLEKGDSLETLKTADITVLGAGEPGLVKPEHIKDGAALIDAGTSESEGKVAGDADPACAEKASLFTPVPGGVGPIAVAMIFNNLLDLVEKE